MAFAIAEGVDNDSFWGRTPRHWEAAKAAAQADYAALARMKETKV